MNNFKFKITNKSKQTASKEVCHNLHTNKEAGQAVLIAVILSLAVSMLILFGLSLPVTDQIRNANEYLSSKQALINSQMLDDEVLYRLNKGKTVPSVLSLSISNDITSALITDLNSGTKQVVSTSIFNLFTRRTQAIISSNKSILFNYGVWVYYGGIKMQNASRITGDVFSLGPIVATETSGVTGTVSTSTNSVNVPISDDDINNWRNQASSGSTINGSVSLTSGATSTVQATKIVGNLTLKNSVMTLGGPLYVTGNLSLQNQGEIRLNSSYGTKSETIVVDGIISVEGNGAYLGGSGTVGSNLILATQSTSGCPDVNCTNYTPPPAIYVENTSAAGAILVAPHGAVYMKNTGSPKGVFANYLFMTGNSYITYDSSLIDISFNSSTSTAWDISSLKEI